MKFKVDEIAAILEREISSFDGKLETAQVGKVIEVGDGIAHIYGLKNAMAGEMLLFPNNIYGQVFNLEEETVGAVVLGDYFQIKEGDLVRSTGQLLSVPVGRQLLGRVVNPLGQAIDGGPPIQATETRKVDIIAPGIADRQPVKEPLQTGIKAIDTMIYPSRRRHTASYRCCCGVHRAARRILETFSTCTAVFLSVPASSPRKMAAVR